MNSTILYKYFNHQASEEEIALLFEWIEENPEHKPKFIRLKAAYAMAVPAEIDQLELDHRRSQLQLRKTQFKPWRYAAVFIVLLASGLLWYTTKDAAPGAQPPLVLEINNAQKTIQLEEVSVIEAADGSPIATFSKEQLAYVPQPSSAPVTSQLVKVPYGKTLNVKLPDGTRVVLNAGSTLAFPSRFEGAVRKVTLTGEGFFDVTKNKQQPFIVQAQNLNVEVLGTRFNVQAYPENSAIETALEEGSVKLFKTGTTQEQLVLSPGEMGTFDIQSHALSKKRVNMEQKIAWTRGELLLDNTALPDILKRLERHFNLEITNTYPKLEQESFSGTVKLDLGIQGILQLLQLDTDFRYTLKGNQLILTKPKNN